ncbi:phytanoyl-CoA dioxygenase family protein, partial [bacterium]|nr:phytanoyl-CoA dioxygenase family protein [bacterium]
ICSAWIAIDESTVANSCVQIIPGSHRKVIPHIKATKDTSFHEMGDDQYYDSDSAVDVEMKPGEFILFNERTLHHSHPNTSDKRRIGLAIRVILPFVTVLKYDSPAHTLPLIHGDDRMGFNRLAEALPSS